MFVRKTLIERTIKVFMADEAMRDDRWLFLEYMVNTYYKDDWGKDVRNTAKLAWDIDRSFRYVQQHIGRLQGRMWMRRQWMGGEISYQEYMDYMKDIGEVSDQLELDFE